MEAKKFVTVLLLILLVGGTIHVSAVTPQERRREAVERYNKAKESYRNAVEGYKNAREDYMHAVERFRKSRKPNDSAVTIEKAKTLLLKLTDGMIKYLEMLEKRGEFVKLSEEEKTEIKAEIEQDITWLKNKQDAINSATTREELVAIAKEVKDYWGSIRGKTKSIVGRMLSAHIDAIILRTENASAKIENTIQKLKEKGKDTSKLETLLADFKGRVELAKQANEKAKEKFKAIKDIKDADKLFREGHAFVKEANKYIREAYRILKEIFKEFKSEGRVELAGEGKLTASGNGRAEIEGTGTVTVNLSSGEMTVSSNADVQTDGNKTELGGGKVKYQKFTSATVTGENIEVDVSGNGIELTAEGKGTAKLSGNGNYTACGVRCVAGNETALTGSWNDAGVKLSIHEGKVM